MEHKNTEDKSDLQHIGNEQFDRNEEKPPVYPSFIMSKDMRLVPVVCGLPMDPENELSWELHDQGIFGMYIARDVYDAIDHDKEYILLDAITATSILGKPKEEAQEAFKKIMERAHG